jgi:hypothetical protein
MQPRLTPDQRRMFADLATFIYDKISSSFDDLASEIERAEKAEKMMGDALSAGRDQAAQAALDDVKKAFDQVCQLNHSAYLAISTRVAQSSEKLCGPVANPQLPEIENAEHGDALAVRKLETLAFSLAIIRFFYAAALMSLHASISSYIDLCEAYLGHDIGSHDVMNRIKPVIREIGLAVGALAIPAVGFIDAGVECIRQAGNTPARVAREKAIRDAEGLVRQMLLTDSLMKRAASASFDDGIVNTSVSAVVEERAAFAELLKSF